MNNEEDEDDQRATTALSKDEDQDGEEANITNLRPKGSANGKRDQKAVPNQGQKKRKKEEISKTG
jgi:hypothetical protein